MDTATAPGYRRKDDPTPPWRGAGMTDLATTRIALPGGIVLNVATGGRRGGEPIVFLHGFPESHRTWRHQIAHLSRQYRCIAPDQRGYARSDKPAGVEAYRVPHLVADVIDRSGVLAGRKPWRPEPSATHLPHGTQQ